MSDAAGSGASTSSVQIQSAIDQLTFLQRILHGDDDMSLSDLLASTSASGPSSSLPSGGLSKALPSLLSPVLSSSHKVASMIAPTYGSANGGMQEAALAQRAAFQPRRYLEMSNVLNARISDKNGETYSAINLAQKIGSEEDAQKSRERKKGKILRERKRRRIEAAQQAILDGKKAQSNTEMTFDVLPSFQFPGNLQEQAESQETNASEMPSEEKLTQFILAWQLELQRLDNELSGRVKASILQWTSRNDQNRALIGMKIDQMGFAWIWVTFQKMSNDDGIGLWHASITRVNILAESEVDSYDKASLVATGLQTSRFPLYRRLSLLLSTKLLTLEPQKDRPWSHLIVALFAISVLCRLHDLQQSTAFIMNDFTTLRGQDNILNALMCLEIAPNQKVNGAAPTIEISEKVKDDTIASEVGPRKASQENFQDKQAEQSPQSALFSDSHTLDASSPS